MTEPARTPQAEAPEDAPDLEHEQPPGGELEILSAELRHYAHRLVDLRSSSTMPAGLCGEAAELGYTRRYISASLRQAPCRTCVAAREACPLVRLWQRTRARIDALETRAARH